MTSRVRPIAPAELEALLPELVELLCEAVDGGASLGFLPPLRHDEARRYWRSLDPELRGSARLLFVAVEAGRLVGAGQLALPSWPNARHRAEVQKLLVAAAHRGRGIGRTILQAMHEHARHRGRWLFLLNARRGDPAESFYKRLGYREIGVVPEYTVGPAGETYDNVAMYWALRAEDPCRAPPASISPEG